MHSADSFGNQIVSDAAEGSQKYSLLPQFFKHHTDLLNFYQYHKTVLIWKEFKTGENISQYGKKHVAQWPTNHLYNCI